MRRVWRELVDSVVLPLLLAGLILLAYVTGALQWWLALGLLVALVFSETLFFRAADKRE